MRTYKNYIQFLPETEGDERRMQLLQDIVDNCTFLPKTIGYKDIDESFKEWAEKELPIHTESGEEYPTYVLFSNQRFSEYSQSWKHVDDNNNLLLSFKTVTRENNPQYGNIQHKLWNIPDTKYYLIHREKVLDDNGTESFLDFRMKQPTAVDLNYKVGIFTTNYQKINEFNELMNRKFNCCQCYVFPNGHPMPMKLDSITDESQYNIDDRQYYAQFFSISLMGYIIAEDDYRVEERPYKLGGAFSLVPKLKKATVELEECEEPENPYYYKPLRISVNYDISSTIAEFTVDSDFIVTAVTNSNVLPANYKIYVNKEYREKIVNERLLNGDRVKITLKKRIRPQECVDIVLEGYDPETVYDNNKDVPEVVIDETQFAEEKHISVTDGDEIEVRNEKDYVIGKNETKIAH